MFLSQSMTFEDQTFDILLSLAIEIGHLVWGLGLAEQEPMTFQELESSFPTQGPIIYHQKALSMEDHSKRGIFE